MKSIPGYQRKIETFTRSMDNLLIDINAKLDHVAGFTIKYPKENPYMAYIDENMSMIRKRVKQVCIGIDDIASANCSIARGDKTNRYEFSDKGKANSNEKDVKTAANPKGELNLEAKVIASPVIKTNDVKRNQPAFNINDYLENVETRLSSDLYISPKEMANYMEISARNPRIKKPAELQTNGSDQIENAKKVAPKTKTPPRKRIRKRKATSICQQKKKEKDSLGSSAKKKPTTINNKTSKLLDFTLSSISQDPGRNKNCIDISVIMKRTLRNPRYPQIEAELRRWINKTYSRGRGKVKRDSVMKKAVELLKKVDTSGSIGWFMDFLRRNIDLCKKIDRISDK